MKLTFWKHKYELFIGIISLVIISLSFLIAGIVLIIKNHYYWPILILGLISLILTFYILFFQKRVLSKITFSDNGIEWSWLNKRILFINWNDITNIKSSPRGRGAEDLSIISYNDRIDISLTRKMYDAIMILCPYQNIKNQINNIDSFKWFHKNK